VNERSQQIVQSVHQTLGLHQVALHSGPLPEGVVPEQGAELIADMRRGPVHFEVLHDCGSASEAEEIAAAVRPLGVSAWVREARLKLAYIARPSAS